MIYQAIMLITDFTKFYLPIYFLTVYFVAFNNFYLPFYFLTFYFVAFNNFYLPFYFLTVYFNDFTNFGSLIINNNQIFVSFLLFVNKTVLYLLTL